MNPNIRLVVTKNPETGSVSFSLAFAATTSEGDGYCGEAFLEFGDGQTRELGVICAPTVYTWRDQRELPLGSHLYADDGDYSPRLRWGERTETCELPKQASTDEEAGVAPTLTFFGVMGVVMDPLRLMPEISITGLTREHQVRVDGGSGQVILIDGGDGAEVENSWLFDYGKPGAYLLSVDLLDAEGFWLTRLDEELYEIAEPVEQPDLPLTELKMPVLDDRAKDQALTDKPTPEAELISSVPSPALMETSSLSTGATPWLPFRYARPLWAWARTYRTAGSSRVSRTLASGTYVAIRQETEIDGALWYETGSFDWIPASSVTLMEPSQLRGVELGQSSPDPEPEPEPEPEPTPDRRGRITANVLNVRARPGVSAGNPPIDRLSRNTEVDIFGEDSVAGAIWYEIGEDRWVHSGWVQLIDVPPEPEPVPEPEPEPEPETRQGKVVANVLNVRAAPGVRGDNPPVDRLFYGTIVSIAEERVYNGAIWYRIGEDRWVHSGWVQLVDPSPGQTVLAPAPLGQSDRTEEKVVSLPVGWVVSSTLKVRSQPGTGDNSIVVGEVLHNQRLDILATQVVAGATWYRVGEDRWVHGSWVGVARGKARPSSIGADERWVAVNLSEQTAVAYEGDRPVYAALVATGLPGFATVQGIFRTWWRLTSRKMSGGSGSGYYYLEEVTWTCYFHGGYALHTAYWHDAFGRPRSHGCVNLSPYDAWWLFQWSEPSGDNSPAVYVYWA